MHDQKRKTPFYIFGPHVLIDTFFNKEKKHKGDEVNCWLHLFFINCTLSFFYVCTIELAPNAKGAFLCSNNFSSLYDTQEIPFVDLYIKIT